MNTLLMTLKKAVDGAVAVHAATHEIALDAFPGHAVRALEHILRDDDEQRAVARLARLEAEVETACALVKEGTSDVIRVARFGEPLLTAKPQVAMELPVPHETDGGASHLAKDASLGTALAALAEEVAKLERAMGQASDADVQEDEAPTPAAKADEGAVVQAHASDDAGADEWPADMNTTLPGAEPAEPDATLDWGPDPKPSADGR